MPCGRRNQASRSGGHGTWTGSGGLGDCGSQVTEVAVAYGSWWWRSWIAAAGAQGRRLAAAGVGGAGDGRWRPLHADPFHPIRLRRLLLHQHPLDF
jgi:hypothetical protein